MRTYFFLFLGFLIFMEVYNYRSLLRYFAEHKKWVKIIYLSTVAFSLLLILSMMFKFPERSINASVTRNIISGLFVCFIVAKLFFFPFPFLEDMINAFRFLKKRANKSVAEATELGSMWSRRKFIGKLGLAVAALPFSAFLYGIIKGKYDFSIHRVSLSFPDLPDAFDGFKLVQISDVHAGSFDDLASVQKGLRMIQEQSPDMIVFTGDLVNSRAREVQPYLDSFAELTAPFGKYSILGNHDYGKYVKWESPEKEAKNLERLFNYHQTMGFQLLNNERVSIEKEGSRIELAGVENWGKPPFPQRGDLKAAFKNSKTDDFSILLSHDPSHWDEQIINYPQKIHLTLSGHTHGMQAGVEIPGFRWSPVKYRYPRWAGLYEEQEQYLYVNRGFGFIGFPGRVGIWPEITVIELKKGVV